MTTRLQSLLWILLVTLSSLFLPNFTFAFQQGPVVETPSVDRTYAKQEFVGDGGKKLLYRWYIPATADKEQPVPLLIFLHGAGERGDDNEKTLIHGAKDFLSDKLQEGGGCAVLIPQCPEDEQWVNTPWSADSHQIPEHPSPSMGLLIQLLDTLEKDFPIDKNRVYLTGLSMGGFGAWDLACRQPKRFAALVPICGGGDSRESVAKTIAHIPIWAFHGDEDNAVKVSRTRDMISAIKSVGGSPKYTEYAGVGHNSWTESYANPDLYKWILMQRISTGN